MPGAVVHAVAGRLPRKGGQHEHCGNELGVANSPMSGNECLVLLALADACAPDDGTGRRPSAATIARKADVSDRTVLPAGFELRSRLRRALPCMPLTSGNEFSHTMIGGVSGEGNLVVALVLVGRACRSAHDAPAPSRFPTLLVAVHWGPGPSVSCADACWPTAGERCRTGVNETQTEPRPSGRAQRASRSPGGGRQPQCSRNQRPPKGYTFTRFRGLCTTIHHRPPTFLTRRNRQPVSARERLWTGVNETQTEPTPGALAVHAGLRLGGSR